MIQADRKAAKPSSTPPIAGVAPQRPVAVMERATKLFLHGQEELYATRELDFELYQDEFCSIVGPSGCGKSTMLRMIAGIETPTAGTVTVHGDGTDRPHTAVAFQEYGIFPWKTVRANVEFGLRMHHVPKAEARERASEWIQRIGLSQFKDSYPAQLSGGMKQRVSLARALALDPHLLLLDEPFAALDAQLRSIFQTDLLRLWQEGPRRSAMFVTHSLDEAILLSDRIVLVSARPASVKRIFIVPFGRPRTPDIRNEPEFAALRQEIWELLREDVNTGVGSGQEVAS